MKTFNDYIKSIKDGTDLSVNESENAFDQILLPVSYTHLRAHET